MCGREEDGAGVPAAVDELEACRFCGHGDDHIDRRDGCASCNPAGGPCAAPGAEDYNGWRNRETWCVHLWLAAEPSWRNAAEVAVAVENQDRAEARIRDLTELAAGARHPRGLGDELLAAALARVDWPAIVAAFEPEEA